MIKKKLEPGLVSCNYVLTYCSKHKQGMVAMEFLMVMKKVSESLGGGGVFGRVDEGRNNGCNRGRLRLVFQSRWWGGFGWGRSGS